MSTQSQSTTAAMNVKLQTPGVHHVALRVSDLERARRFYINTLGFEVVMDNANLVIFSAGGTAIALRAPDEKTPKNDTFNPFTVGLDHLALACTDEAELERVAAALKEASIENTGVKLDETLGKKYVAFKDPDRIAWEFYMA